MTVKEILEMYWEPDNNRFSDLFIQLFVESNGAINYAYFNKFHEGTYSFKTINSEIKALSGNKVVPYRLPDFSVEDRPYAFEAFVEQYSFGKHVNPRQYIYTVWQQTDTVLARGVVLSWVAKQRPDKVHTSFAPANDRNHYHDTAESKPRSKPDSRSESEVGFEPN